MPAATVDSVKLLLAAQLGYSDDVNGTADVTKLSSFWTPILTEATREAEVWLRMTLGGMGFPAEEVSVWPMFSHYHRRLALWLAGAYRAGELSAEQKSALDRLDPRAEVLALTTLGGAADDEGLVGVGDMERDDDLFRRPGVDGSGRLPADIFNCNRVAVGRDVWR
jgi:hypothetical protein